MSVRLDTVSRHGAGRPPAPGSAPRRKGRFGLTRLDIKLSPYMYIAPFFIVFAIFGFWPFLYTVWVSLHNWTLIGGNKGWLGGQNFADLLKDDQFWNSLKNTFAMFVLATIPQLLMALALANVLNRRILARTFFRMGIAVPIVTSAAVVGIVFSQLYGREYGIINWLADDVLHLGRIDWHAELWPAWIAVATMVNWQWTGYNALIYLAAMQSIPRDVYESAALDGASQLRQFWSITVPMLRPTIIFTAIISTIGGLQLFTEPVLYSSGAGSMHGGSLRQVQTTTMYLYEVMFERKRIGYAGAIACVLFLIIILSSIVNYLIVRRINSEK